MLSRRPQIDPPIACELMLCELCGRWPDYCMLGRTDDDEGDYAGDDDYWPDEEGELCEENATTAAGNPTW